MSKIEIIPAIDIIDGKCVRLSQGDYNRQTVYDAPPLEMARRYADIGVRRIHVVDLDGAKSSSPANLSVLEQLAGVDGLKIEWGGGIKTKQALEDILSAGASYAVVGSVAARHPELFAEWLEDFGGDKIVLGADISNGRIATHGWLQTDDKSVDDLVEQFRANGLTQAIVTEISRDGMLSGPATSLYIDLQEKYPNVVFTVSGGIGSWQDVIDLDRAGLRRVIVGKAIYENKIPLKFIQEWLQNA